ncbi:MAG: hypothetical protein MZV63_64105 [Marinilabiliales bacterium]|nr:hypothetical protein [Marinilabiliales bacterium]
MPDFAIPAEFTDKDEYLRHLTLQGAEGKVEGSSLRSCRHGSTSNSR